MPFRPAVFGALVVLSVFILTAGSAPQRTTVATTAQTPTTTAVAPVQASAPPVATTTAPLVVEAITSPPAPAVRTATDVCVSDPAYCNPPPTTAPPSSPSWARCGQWWDLARSVGWPEGALPTLDGVMWNESRCQPGAQGPTVCNSRAGCHRALGLVQLLGWSCSPNGCLDPASNLAEALVIYNHEGGWCPAWTGDPAVGRC
jgi:hypothetical protein